MPNFDDALYPVYASLLRAGQPHGPDALTRHPQATRQLIEALGLPLSGLPAITVSGSKGKGSTALFCAAILQRLGYRVGLITSPHLDHFLERIRRNGVRMTEAQFQPVITEIAPVIERVDQQLPAGQYIGPNGVVLACALRWFQDAPVDALVLEVGRGGRFDELGLYANAVTALTSIMAEHLAQLGPTLRDIAWHKAGLIRPGTQAVSGPQPADALAEIQAQITQQQATLHLIQPHDWERTVLTGGQRVHLQHPADVILELGTAAPYQAANAALAAAAVAALGGSTAAPARIDLRALQLAGRCEQLASQPLTLVDGAINAQAAQEFLAGALAISPEPRTLVLSLGADKDAAGLLAVLTPHVAQIIITEARNPNLRFGPDTLAQAQAAHSSVTLIADPLAAFTKAQHSSAGSLWVVGTQSLVRDALQHWGRDLRSIWNAAETPQDH